MDLSELIAQHGPASYDKQHRLAAVVGRRAWQFDLDRGRLTFDGQFGFGAQLLGTMSQQTMTWQWAWASTQRDLPQRLLRRALEVRRFGSEQGVEELTTAKFSIENDTAAHELAMIAAGLTNAAAYYRAPHAAGALYLLLDHSPRLASADDSTNGAAARFEEFIRMFRVEHRPALRAWVLAKGFSIERDDAAILVARGRDGRRLTAAWDAEGRLSSLGIAS